ncbi:MAG: prepilin-type N-terminal cleavage/methylation domain-containing protein [Thermoleophilia bacterium]|nr:prepilin-type N-terminal cleavage/methylation domain-containing protein [Thermoleophilia bacterium]
MQTRPHEEKTRQRACNPNRFGARAARQHGYSLMEVLVVMLIMVVILGAIYGVWQSLTRTYEFTEEDMIAQTQARAAMAEMVEYIRTARQPDTAAIPSLDAVITNAQPFAITMWTDTLRDGTHDLQLIRFRVSPNPLDAHPSGTHFELWREEGDSTTGLFEDPPTRLVTTDVGNDSATYPLFTYRDALGALTTDVTKIREVEISLRIDVDPDRSPATNVLTSTVQPRNLRQ